MLVGGREFVCITEDGRRRKGRKGGCRRWEEGNRVRRGRGKGKGERVSGNSERGEARREDLVCGLNS